jgi:hypothetical protein
VNFAEVLPRVSGKLESYAIRSSSEELRSRYTRISKTLQERLRVARPARENLRALNGADFPVPEAAVPAQQLQATLAAMDKASQGDLLKLLDQAKRWEELKASEKTLDTAIPTGYKRARWKLLPPAPPAFHARLFHSGPLKETYERLLETDAALAKLLPEAVPAGLADRLIKAAELRLTRDNDRAALDLEVPESVRMLLARIEAGTATLADVAAEALDWLRTQEADDEIALAFGGGRES